MLKNLMFISLFLILILVGCAPRQPTPGVDEPGGVCSVDPQSTCVAPTSATQPALYGTWQGVDGQGSITLTVNENTVDLYLAPLDGGGATEMQYAITYIDWARDLLTLVLTRDLVGGQELPVVDTPVYMKVWIDSEVLYFSIAAEPPEKALLGPLSRK